MRIHEALKEEGFAFEYERKRGDDVIEVWVNPDPESDEGERLF